MRGVAVARVDPDTEALDRRRVHVDLVREVEIPSTTDALENEPKSERLLILVLDRFPQIRETRASFAFRAYMPVSTAPMTKSWKRLAME